AARGRGQGPPRRGDAEAADQGRQGRARSPSTAHLARVRDRADGAHRTCSHPRARASRRLLGHEMGVLDEIVAHKREELERLRADTPQAELEAACRGRAPSLPFEAALRASEPGTVRLIAEVKKASPSK